MNDDTNLLEANDLLEAKELLRNALMAKTRAFARVEKDQAAEALMSQIVALQRLPDIVSERLSKHAASIAVGRGEPSVLVSYERGIVQVSKDRQPPVYIPLDLDPETGRFIGTEPDTFRTPVPGTPAVRRPAVAVVVEAALRLLSS